MPMRAETIAENGLVAIVRLDDLSAAVPLTKALLRGGVKSVEFTFTNPLAQDLYEPTSKCCMLLVRQ